jgi:hypothetical protein
VIGVGVEVDSFVSHKPALPNLERIREVGLGVHLGEQRERRLLVEHLLAHYNDGRSMTFYCTACALLPAGLVRGAMEETAGSGAEAPTEPAAVKARAKAMRAAIQGLATEAGIDLRLRRKRG